jgi:hypothetical protein
MRAIAASAPAAENAVGIDAAAAVSARLEVGRRFTFATAVSGGEKMRL